MTLPGPLLVAIIVLVALLATNLFAAELPRAAWPETLKDAVADILSGMSEADKQKLRTTPKGDLIMFHFGWGMGIRNAYGLWGGNTKLIESACGKPCHPDDASMAIIEAVWAALQKKK